MPTGQIVRPQWAYTHGVPVRLKAEALTPGQLGVALP